MVGKIFNGLFFQIAWLACVVGGASEFWWVGPVVVFGFAVWHVPRSQNPKGEIILGSIAMAMGLVFDTALIRLDLVAYPHPGPVKMIAPVWILALWVGFSLTLNHSLSWLHDRPIAAGLLGGIAGPFSYWIGATTWGAIEFTAPMTTVLPILGIGWGVMTPVLLAISTRLGPSTGTAEGLKEALQPNAVSFSEQIFSKKTQGEEA